MPKYPQVKVKLVGEDGNALAIVGRAKRAARQAGLTKEEIDAYVSAALSGDYNNVLTTTMEFFDCDPDADGE